MGTLFLVGTPIGNLEDITLRALRVLREVDLIAAEDTRTTGRLLKHFDIQVPLVSYHEHNEEERAVELVEKLQTQDVALVSDAGMPGLSDPGYRIVAAAAEAGVTVSPVPGPTALSAALVSSGLASDSFLFLGFLPRKQTARREALAEAAALPVSLLLYEAPHRLIKLLADVEEVLGNRRLAVCRELTKLHEEIWRGSVAEALEHFGEAKVRGEITVVVEGAATTKAETWDAAAVRQALQAQLDRGLRRKTAATLVAARSGWRKREVYALSLEIERGKKPEGE